MDLFNFFNNAHVLYLRARFSLSYGRQFDIFGLWEIMLNIFTIFLEFYGVIYLLINS